MPTIYPKKAAVERKVKAATAGAGSGAVIGEFINWLLDDYVITPQVTGDLPGPVSGLVLVASAGLAALIAGYWAKHSARPDLPMEKR